MPAGTAHLPSTDLDDAVERAADPVAARTLLTRLLDAHPALADELYLDALVRDGVVALASASRSLSSALVADPTLLDPLRDPGGFVAERSTESYAHSWSAFGDHSALGLRRWKRRELLRVAVRDLLGVADLPAVGRELAALADVCLGAALALADPGVPMAVIGMGKLGGRELNYSSDVDVLFVHDGDTEEAIRAARALLSAMTTTGEGGIVFRTDANLRPEGRAGPLSRTLGSYASYYAEWAATWEFQSLLKARPVAGDADLAAGFMDLTRPYVWPAALDPDAIREIRTMKTRSEELTDRRGLADRELKRGRGGIRDIEFAVQLLQLVHGRADDTLRSPTTLDALAALADGGYVDRRDARRLDEAYRFLRTVEHRLQLHDEQQTHTIPADEPSLRRLARVLGFRDRPEESAVEQFEHDQRRHQAVVRAIHERLFFAPLLETLAGAGALSLEAAEDRLAAFGFRDIQRLRGALRELADGLTRRSKLMAQLMPVILSWLSTTPDPDLGLVQLRRLAEGPARSASLARTLRDSPGAVERACTVLGSSRVAGDALRREPEFVERLGDDVALAEEATRERLVDDALRSLRWRADDRARREGLRRFKRRELLRIASRDILGFADLDTSERELTRLAEACLEAAVAVAEPRLPFTVVGMGRLGGAELSYASDIDVLFVYEGTTPEDFAEAERVATSVVLEIGETTAEGQTFRIDARLRPEGNNGPLARSFGAYTDYYRRYALTWERQALTKARVVAGDAGLGERFRTLVGDVVYGAPFTDDNAREVRRMKARIERERIPPGEDPQYHLKLGRGSLSDIEFTAQLLQLVHGGADESVRVTGTIDALTRLHEHGFLADDDAETLEAAYRYCERARNAWYLLSSRPSDALPTNAFDLTRLGVLLGYVHLPSSSLRDDYRRVTRRARRVVERVFYASR